MDFKTALFILALVSSDMIILDLLHRHYSKKCKYDCDKCRCWDCPKKYCDKKRDKLNKLK